MDFDFSNIYFKDYLRRDFLVRISFLGKDGKIIDLQSDKEIIKIVNKSSLDIFSKILNVFSWNLLGFMQWDFDYDGQVIFRLKKGSLERFIFLEYFFDSKFYRIYKIEFNSFPIFSYFSTIKIFDVNDKEVFRCFSNRPGYYVVRDLFNNDVCYITRHFSLVSLNFSDYRVFINNFLSGVENYIFLSLPLIISIVF